MDPKMKFIAAAKYYELQEAKLKEAKSELEGLMNELGVGTYIQDPDTTAVYKVVKPTGTFIFYKEIDYKRTALEGEKGGNVLAKKEAEEQGFVVRKTT